MPMMNSYAMMNSYYDPMPMMNSYDQMQQMSTLIQQCQWWTRMQQCQQCRWTHMINALAAVFQMIACRDQWAWSVTVQIVVATHLLTLTSSGVLIAILKTAFSWEWATKWFQQGPALDEYRRSLGLGKIGCTYAEAREGPRTVWMNWVCTLIICNNHLNK